MVIKYVNLDIVIGVTSKLPQTDMPEFAMAGKSNVGKSSLINALLNRKSYARTSANPGKTQTINFYNVNKEMYLVDLPGYGYATANQEAKASWGKMIESYLKKSEQLKKVLLLLDCRRTPSENDMMMFSWIRNAGFEPLIVLTKADKLKRMELKKQEALIKKTLNLAEGEKMLTVSAEKKIGIDELWDEIVSF